MEYVKVVINLDLVEEVWPHSDLKGKQGVAYKEGIKLASSCLSEGGIRCPIILEDGRVIELFKNEFEELESYV